MSYINILNWNELVRRNKAGDYLMYDNRSKVNVIFIGSCRITTYMYFFNSLTSLGVKPNIYGISCITEIPNIVNFKGYINNLLKDTTHIISEFITNYGILNSNPSSEETFLKTFRIKNDTVYSIIPNLECRFHTSELIRGFSKPINNEILYSEYISSREILRKLLYDTGYDEINTFIDRNFTRKRLFHIHSHPTSELMLKVFTIFLKKNNILYDEKYVNNLINLNIFKMHNAPIFQRDILLYKFKWCRNVFLDSQLETAPMFVNIHVNTYE